MSSDQGFGYGGYRGAPISVPAYTAPPPPPSAPIPPQYHHQDTAGNQGIPLPPIYGPLRGILNTAPPNQPFDQQPLRQTVRFGNNAGPPVTGGPGAESSVPFSLFSQMLLRMEKLEKENELLMKVVMELNDVIERDRGNSFAVYTHPTAGTSKRGPASPKAAAEEPPVTEQPPPWRIRK